MGCGSVTGHGHARRGHTSPEYRSWMAMKVRCYSTKHRMFYRYGGRGIRVCDRWLDSFQAFLEDVGPKPTKEHTLDRLDGDRGYEPDNCRWATRKEQAQNRAVRTVFAFRTISVTCETCNESFAAAIGHGAKFCSGRCKATALRERRRAA